MKILISSTNNIEGYSIVKYVDPICANVVIGTNYFSDLAASITDLIGGYSYTYQNKMDLIYKDAINVLKDKAVRIGANCIVGLKIDFDEISGKGKSMFMISASGTACIIEQKNNNNNRLDRGDIVYQSDLKSEVLKRTIISRINNHYNIESEWIEYLLYNPIIEIIDNLLSRYCHYYHEELLTERKEKEVPFIQNYIELFPSDFITDYLYKKREEDKEAMDSLIKESNKFDAKKVLSAFENDVISSIPLLEAESSSYCKDDIPVMKKIYSIIENMPDLGKIETSKVGIFNKEEKQTYICPKGHKNNIENEFCENLNCELNIKGLNLNQIKIIQSFKVKIEALEYLLNK